MIENFVNIFLLKIFSAYFSEKMRSKFQKFVYLEADFPYMEMHANFNLIFLKNYIFETI